MMNVRKILLVPFLMLMYLGASAQVFEIIEDESYVDSYVDFIEDKYGNYLALKLEISDQGIYDGKLIRFDSDLQQTSLSFNTETNSCGLSNILETEQGYFISGTVWNYGDQFTNRFFTTMVSYDMEILWFKEYLLPEEGVDFVQKIKSNGDEIVLGGYYYEGDFPIAAMFRTNHQGDSLDFYSYKGLLPVSSRIMDFLVKPDLNGYYLIGTGFEDSGFDNLVEVNNTFEVQNVQKLPYTYRQPYTTTWYTDTSFILSSRLWDFENPNDRDIGLQHLSINNSQLSQVRIGTPDTLNYVCWGDASGFIDRNRIFVGGVHHACYAGQANHETYIYASVLDSNLNLLADIRYGDGETVYEMNDIIPLNDGGIVFTGIVKDVLPENGSCRGILIKFALDDFPIGVEQWREQEEVLTLYPNPGTEHLYINSKTDQGTIILYDLQGRKQMEVSMFRGITILNTHKLSPGIYTWQLISDNNQIIQNGKMGEAVGEILGEIKINYLINELKLY